MLLGGHQPIPGSVCPVGSETQQANLESIFYFLVLGWVLSVPPEAIRDHLHPRVGIKDWEEWSRTGVAVPQLWAQNRWHRPSSKSENF